MSAARKFLIFSLSLFLIALVFATFNSNPARVREGDSGFGVISSLDEVGAGPHYCWPTTPENSGGCAPIGPVDV